LVPEGSFRDSWSSLGLCAAPIRIRFRGWGRSQEFALWDIGRTPRRLIIQALAFGSTHVAEGDQLHARVRVAPIRAGARTIKSDPEEWFSGVVLLVTVVVRFVLPIIVVRGGPAPTSPLVWGWVIVIVVVGPIKARAVPEAFQTSGNSAEGRPNNGLGPVPERFPDAMSSATAEFRALVAYAAQPQQRQRVA
jgi:hypothetical protein